MWLKIIDILLNCYNSFSQNKRKDKERLSKIFLEVSVIISSCVDLLKEDKYPHNYCAIMLHLSKDIANELSDILDMDKLVELESLLITCSRLELEYTTRKDESTIDTLTQASAQFRSLSILYI
jgi:hypothetical protein